MWFGFCKDNTGEAVFVVRHRGSGHLCGRGPVMGQEKLFWGALFSDLLSAYTGASLCGNSSSCL